MFGQTSIAMLLADREFFGADWLNRSELRVCNSLDLVEKDIPFSISMIESLLATTGDGRRLSLATRLTTPRKGRKVTATLTGMTTPLHFAATAPKGGKAVIVATNRPGHRPLATYAKRWAIERLFGNTKTRSLNFEDTRLTDPVKLHLLTAIIGLAMAWAVRAARTLL